MRFFEENDTKIIIKILENIEAKSAKELIFELREKEEYNFININSRKFWKNHDYSLSKRYREVFSKRHCYKNS